MNLSLKKDSKSEGLIDEQLVPYLNSADDADTQEQLRRLLETARPIVYRIVRSMRSGGSSLNAIAHLTTQDIFGEVCLRLLQSLRALKADPQQYPISNFAGLVATTTSTVLSDLLRGRDRRRKNLREKIVRLFAANPSLSTWKDGHHNLVCGYAVWRLGKHTSHIAGSQMELDFRANKLRDARTRNTGELILLVLDNLGRPVRFDELIDLVNIAAEGVQVQTISIEDKHYVQSSSLATSQPDIVATIDNHRLLHRLFAEIQNLRLEQRKSLLLNMTDCYGYGIEWFLFSRIATEEHLANLLELSVADFRKLLNDLPMTDDAIARELGISQTKVMNMRRAVRERLERRRRAFFDERTSDSVRMK